MCAEERHRTIVNLALRYDRVSVADLATQLDVTTEIFGVLFNLMAGVAVAAAAVVTMKTVWPKRDFAVIA